MSLWTKRPPKEGHERFQLKVVPKALPEAEKLARHRVTDRNVSPAPERRNGSNTASDAKPSNGNRSRRQVNATQTTRRGGEKAKPPTTQNVKRSVNATGAAKLQKAKGQ